MGIPAQVPSLHLSVWVQRLASSHTVVFGAFGFEQVPLAGLQVPARWHTSSAVQVTGLPPVQTPALQASVRVQPSPSLHPVPSASAGFEHTPVPGSQTRVP
jgi:hypothetical protein